MKKFTLLIVASAFCISLQAQTLSPKVISSSGAFFSNASGMLSETVGELAAVTTLAGGSNFLTQGFQQPLDFDVAVPELPSNGFGVEVYPNPGNGLFNIALHTDNDTKVTLSVFDIVGHAVLSQAISHSMGFGVYQMNLKNLTAGVFMLEIVSKDISGNNTSVTVKKLQLIN